MPYFEEDDKDEEHVDKHENIREISKLHHVNVWLKQGSIGIRKEDVLRRGDRTILEGIDLIELGWGENSGAAERTGGVEILLSLLDIPLQGTVVMDNVGVVAAVHAGCGRGLVDLFVADATAEVGMEDQLPHEWLGE